MTESEVMQACMLEMSKHQDVIMFWRNNTGMIMVGNRPVRFGQLGSGDILGLIKPTGRAFAMEVKSSKGKLRESQIAWSGRFVKYGGLYIVINGGENVIKQINEKLLTHCKILS